MRRKESGGPWWTAARCKYDLRRVALWNEKSGLQLDLPRSPGFLEPGLKGAVESSDGEPGLAGNGLYPVVCPAQAAASGRSTRTLRAPSGALQAPTGLSADPTSPPYDVSASPDSSSISLKGNSPSFSATLSPPR